MNLGKLLAAGRSFFGGQGAVAYRTNRRVYLPKFNESNAAAPAPALTAPAPAAGRRLNPFRPTARAVAPPPVPRVVQPELSLDSVKVVHNDLADADIEVVPVRSRTTALRESVALPAARAEVMDFFATREATTA